MIASIANGPAGVQRPPARPASKLVVRSARIGEYDGADRLDITRIGIGGKPDPLGVLFAPSESILRPAIRAREIAEELRHDADDLTKAFSGQDRRILVARADQLEAEAWAKYEPLYLAEMRASYREHRRAWEELLGRPSLVVLCFCVLRPGAPQRCHRALLRSRILPALGATDGGEIGASS